jgi:hypothetical protein
MLDCIIIGGGIHGTYLSNLLTSELGYSNSKVRVIDPHDEVCGRWRELTSRTGMQFLRSPSVHSLDVSPWGLSRYQKRNQKEPWARSLGSTQRPSLAMFNRHIDCICREGELNKFRIKGEATAIRKTNKGLEVQTTAGSFQCREVIMSISSNDKLEIPSWAVDIAPVAKHVFEPSFSLTSLKNGDKIVVVGSGISAAQVALSAAQVSPGNVQLFIRHPLKIAEFDADPCWMGPKCLSLFAAEKDYSRRREMIKSARNKGTVTPEVFAAVRRAEAAGALKVVLTEVETAWKVWNNQATLLDSYRNHLCLATHVLLATGFAPGRPGGKLLDQVIAAFDMPVARDGFPIVDRNLHWKDQIYVSGALAELEVGPPARNILGARLAGARLARVLKPFSAWDFATTLVASSLHGFPGVVH